MKKNSIESRVALIEDQLAIYQLLSAMAPIVDGGAADEMANFFTPDGSYVVDVTGSKAFAGRDAIAGVYGSDYHQSAVRQGISHMLGFPHVRIAGDKAHAVTYACIFRCNDDGWYVARIAANSFDLVRGDGDWKISKRVSLELNSDQARALFSGAPMDVPWSRPAALA